MRFFSRSVPSLVLLAALSQGCTPTEDKDASAGAAGSAAAGTGQAGAGQAGAAGSAGGAAGSTAGGSAGAQAGTAGAAGSEAGGAGQAGSGGAGQGGAGQGGAGQGGAGQGGAGSGGSAGSAPAGAGGAAGSEAGGAGQGGAAAGGGGSGGQTASTLAVLKPGAKEVAEGEEVAESNLDGIPPYSDGIVDLTLVNKGTEPLVIEGVSLEGLAPALEGEWRLSKSGSTAYEPITIENATIEPGKSASFAGFFSPYASGPRKAKVTIKHGGGKVFSLTLAGRGRDNAEFSPRVAATKEVIFGDPAGDLLTGGMVSDESGNVWASANATQWKDNFTQNIAVYQTKPDGTLGWAKVWNEPFDQRQPDPGQNAESGGGADCIAADATHLYLAGRRSLDNSNSLFQTLVFKVDKATGAVAWAKGISMASTPDPKVAADSSEGYAIDASHADRVLVTGNGGDASGGTGYVTLFALDKGTGDLIFDQLIDVVAGSQDRGMSLVSDGAGNAYVGGIASGKAMLLRVNGVDTATPKLEWARQVGLGVGGNINSLAIDPGGDVYASLDRRGATTFLSVARVSKAGALVWGKTWDDQNTGDNNNSYVVRHHGGKVYFGGRVAINPFDTQYADGFLLEASGADGAYGWAAFYYNGKGAEEMTEHRVKGIGFGAAGEARALLQSYTNGLNFDHYWGYWYQAPDYTKELPAGDGLKRYVDYAPDVTAIDNASMKDAPKATAHTIDTAAIWVDPQETATLSPLKTRSGPGGDGSSVIQALKITP